MRFFALVAGLVFLVPTVAEASLGTDEWSNQYDNWVRKVQTIYTFYPDPPVFTKVYNAFLCPSLDTLAEGALFLYQGDVSQSPRMTGVKTLEQFGECRLFDGKVPVRVPSWIGIVPLFAADGRVVEGNVYKGVLDLSDGSVDVYVLVPPQPVK